MQHYTENMQLASPGVIAERKREAEGKAEANGHQVKKWWLDDGKWLARCENKGCEGHMTMSPTVSGQTMGLSLFGKQCPYIGEVKKIRKKV